MQDQKVTLDPKLSQNCFQSPPTPPRNPSYDPYDAFKAQGGSESLLGFGWQGMEAFLMKSNEK